MAPKLPLHAVPSCRAGNADGARVCACGQIMAVSRPIGPGSLIASRYEVLRELGAGGMGLVFEAHDRKLDLRVAVKIVRASSLDELLAERFRSEIKLAWKVRHKNVASIHEYGEDGDLLYISMELVTGWNLRQLLQERGAFLWEQGYDAALQIGAGLEAIHDAGVIHRDLKSANVMVEPSGSVRVMDFGIAKAGDQAQPGLTATGQVVGSPEYMSPEQVRGGALDFRSDLYAFGIVIYEIFSGRVPFRGDSPVGTMLMHLQDPPPLEGPEAAQIPPALVEVLRKALAKDPAGRPGSCREMNAALRAAREALDVQATDAAPAAASASSLFPDSDERPTRLVRPQAGPPAAGRVKPEPAPPEARLLVPTLIRALGHAEPDVRASAARSLASLGTAAVPAAAALGQALQDPASGVRLEAVRALDSMGAAAGGVLAALLSAGRDTDPRVRLMATETLTRLARPMVDRDAPPAEPAPAPPLSAAALVAPAPSVPKAGTGRPATPSPSVARSASALAAPPVSQPRRAAPAAPPPPEASARSETPPKRLVLAMTGLGVLSFALWLFRPWTDPGVSPTRSSRTTLPASPSPPAPAGPSTTTMPATSPPPPASASPPAVTVTSTPMLSLPAAHPSTPPKARAEKGHSPKPSPPPTSPPPPSQPPSPSPSAPIEETTKGDLAGAPPLPTLPPLGVPPTPTPAPVVKRGELARIDETGVTPPERLRGAPPEYPALAIRRNLEGVVELRLLVDENGHVEKVEIVKAVDLLTEAAVKAVRLWDFRPALKHGVPVKMWIAQPVEFHLSR